MSVDPRDWPGYDRGAYGDVVAKIHVDDLEDWWPLLAAVEDWLLHAAEDTVADYTRFAGAYAPTFNDVVYMLRHMASYMRALAEGAPK
jgi:hypothetical protein